MDYFAICSLHRKPWFLAALVITSASVAPTPTRAGIIIDDFVDDLRIELPKQNTERVLRDGIGELDAFRSMYVSGLGTTPEGHLTINEVQPSALTIELPVTNHTNRRPILEAHLHYTFTSIPFDGVDLTESGRNNAVFLTFDHLTAAIPLRGLRVSATYGPRSGHYSSALRPMPQSADPFTLVFPFDEFHLDRGSPADQLVFSNARELDVVFALSLIDPNFPEQLDFEMALTEVRIGAIPEPSTLVGSLLMTLLAVVPLGRLSG